MNPHPDMDLDAVVGAAWACLSAGAAGERTAFGRMQVATLGRRGWPEVRTVMLRDVDPVERRVVFHTDRRSAKASEIEGDGRTALHLWDPAANLQLRLWGQARVMSEGADVEAAWARLHPGQRALYSSALGPGRMLNDPAEADIRRIEAGISAPGSFAVVPVTIVRLEWLHLRPEGHRRACFDWSREGWQGRWLVP